MQCLCLELFSQILQIKFYKSIELFRPVLHSDEKVKHCIIDPETVPIEKEKNNYNIIIASKVKRDNSVISFILYKYRGKKN